jgi:paraquat-inducible protein B
MSKRANPRLVGAFVMVAVLLAVLGIATFGSGRLFRDTESFVLYFDQSLDGLQNGAPVKFKGVQIGQVKEVLLSLNQEQARRWADVVLPVVIEIDQDRIRKRGAVAADFRDPAFVDTAIAQGLRASLRLESFVTGRRYIQLDVYPGTPEAYHGFPDEPYRELPTILPAGFEELEATATTLLSRIARIDYEGLADSVSGLISDLRGLAAVSSAMATSLPATLAKFGDAMDAYADLAVSIDTALVPLRSDVVGGLAEATATLTEVRGAFANLEGILEPGSPITARLESALTEMGEAARALRVLAEFLEQNPSALVRGKPEREN